MKFFIDFYKAAQDYRKHVNYLIECKAAEETEREELLSLERFAIHLQNEWPKYAGAREK